MSPRRNWDSPTPSLASERAPPSGTKGGGVHSLAGEGLWGPIPTTGEKLSTLPTLRAGCSLLRAEGFSCSLNVLYIGLGISNMQISIKKRYKKNTDPDSFEMLDPDLHPDPDSINPDPQH
jgi:hypothetical protein